MLTRESVTFRDADGWSWEFDLTFMLSNYRCIWGRGCPDTRLQRTARGCCVEGVEIYQGDGDAPGRQDLKKIRGRLRQLTDEDWQNRRVALARGGRDPWGKARFKRDSVHTRLYRGACIFHHRVDHPGGAGCAFHVAALRRDEDPMDWKPRICWQVPLFFDIDDDTKTTIVRPCRTVDWGGEGILDWWCTEHPDAFNADQPRYVTMGAELRRVCGAAVYEELTAYCRARQGSEPRELTLLPVIPGTRRLRWTARTSRRSGCRNGAVRPTSRGARRLSGSRRPGAGSWPAPRLAAAIGRCIGAHASVRLIVLLAFGRYPQGESVIAPLRCAPGRVRKEGFDDLWR